LTGGVSFDIIYNWRKKYMNIDTAYLLILACSIYLSYQYGKKDGIGATLDYMKEQGKIDFED
jgi:hypothetical protein|tara:strand:- start:682 stop:867 length:186 start_codon:yes stop_codon:yes gene_type:complete